MVLLIDGYNVTKFLLSFNGADHNAQRELLVRLLGTYRAEKRHQLRQIIAVFDGGLFDHRHREVHNDVVVLSSGRGHSADDVLVDYCEKYGNQAIVVTNDRELQRRCVEHRAQTVPVAEFERLLLTACERTQIEEHTQFGAVAITKFESDDGDNAHLDELMLGASIGVVQYKEDDENDLPGPVRKKRKRSKSQRAHDQLKKRLG